MKKYISFLMVTGTVFTMISSPPGLEKLPEGAKNPLHSEERERVIEKAAAFREQFEKKKRLEKLRDKLRLIATYRFYVDEVSKKMEKPGPVFKPSFIENEKPFEYDSKISVILAKSKEKLNQVHALYAIAGYPEDFETKDITQDNYKDLITEVNNAFSEGGALEGESIEKEAQELNKMIGSDKRYKTLIDTFNELKTALKEFDEVAVSLLKEALKMERVAESQSEAIQPRPGEKMPKNNEEHAKKIKELEDEIDRIENGGGLPSSLYRIGSFYLEKSD